MTIKDIAKAVGVSHTTVSNVINGKTSKVSSDTIFKVNEAIKKFNYIPNKNAQALANNSSKIIVLILPNTNNDHIRDPFQSQLLTGIESYISSKNYYLMVKSINRYDEIYQLITNWSVDGIIVQALVDHQLPDLNKFLNIPVIFIDTYFKELKNISIGCNDYRGEYLATKHLLENGHSSIGFICYKILEPSVLSQRLNGFKDAIAEFSIDFNLETDVFQVDNYDPDDLELNRGILNFVKTKSAICFSADILAIEVMNMLKENNISIPDDLSIVGFDNLYMSELVTPKLTTINQDILKKGFTAAESIISMIEGIDVNIPSTQLKTNLVCRNSVKKLT